ncbi:MAG TPA: response regulator [Desulfobacter sp.]|nr:response regulator [Desulfobacter sp.]
MDRILFVDEDLALMEVTQRRLNKVFDIDIAQGGREGLNAVAGKGPYAVIITGLHMSGMNGFQFVEEAKKIDSDSAIVMLTGHGRLDVSLKALNGGKIFKFLIKPCKPHVLENVLQEGVEQYRKNRHWAKTVDAASSHRHKILIVDDDPEVLSVFATTVNATGHYDVLTAENGKIALELVKFIKIHAIAADLNIPDMDGIQLLRAIHRREPNMSLFLMTWNPAFEFQDSIPDITLDAVFEKPLDMPSILATIRASLRSDPKGKIEGFSTTAFLQMIEMEEKTCTIQVKSAEDVGFLFFRKGRLIAAATGDKRGEDAAYDILNWKDSAIQITHADLEKRIEINRSLMHILVEAARRQDEAETGE